MTKETSLKSMNDISSMKFIDEEEESDCTTRNDFILLRHHSNEDRTSSCDCLELSTTKEREENTLSLKNVKERWRSSNFIRNLGGIGRTFTMSSFVDNCRSSQKYLLRSNKMSQSCRYINEARMSTSELHPSLSGSQRGLSQNFRARSRSRGLANIDPKFTSQSGLCSSSELETSRGSIRITHLTASIKESSPRFPRLEDCAHFHYEFTEIGPLTIELVNESDEVRPLNNLDVYDGRFRISISSLGRIWTLKRSLSDFVSLDHQIHRCIYDRKYSQLAPIQFPDELQGPKHQDSVRQILSCYLCRFSSLAGPIITCGPVLNWFELDNRGNRLIVTDDSAINTPAVAASYAIKRYAKQAPDELSFEVGDMISVIDMPPPEESIWWRGKRGFEVGFFPCECVEVIGDKVPSGLTLPPSTKTDDETSNEYSDSPSEPTKPVLRKHGKLISFFRSFILSRPSRGKLKKSGILKERVFGCDLSEHLLNSNQEIPKVLLYCSEFIESKGIIDGIYRLSGISSNIQKLRVTFDEDRVPDLYNDKSLLQDIHCVSSLLKMYFRELPNPICTYHLYDKFVIAAKSNENQRLVLLRDVVQQLPPPNYRTLEYLSRHLYRVSLRGSETGMTAKNVAIVWAPNLLRCKTLEIGGVAALQGVGVQAVVTEYLIRYCELIFSDKIPPSPNESVKKFIRPKSLALSTPTKLLTLEEARNRAAAAAIHNHNLLVSEAKYIEVGEGPDNIPPMYHTIIDLPRRSLKIRKSPIAWIFSGSRNKSKLKISEDGDAQDEGHKSIESLNEMNDVAAPLETVTRALAKENGSAKHTSPKTHNRSSSHDSYFDVSKEMSVVETSPKGIDDLEPSFSSKLPSEPSIKDPNSSSLVESQAFDPASSDINEIQVNFELEENEMKIFSEDEAMLSTASLGSSDDEDCPSSHFISSRKLSLSDKLKKITPPISHKKISQNEDFSPKKKKSNYTPGTSPSNYLVKRSKMEEKNISSSIKFIDASFLETPTLVPETFKDSTEPRPTSISVQELTNGDQLVVAAQIHFNQTHKILQDETQCSPNNSSLETGISTEPEINSEKLEQIDHEKKEKEKKKRGVSERSPMIEKINQVEETSIFSFNHTSHLEENNSTLKLEKSENCFFSNQKNESKEDNEKDNEKNNFEKDVYFEELLSEERIYSPLIEEPIPLSTPQSLSTACATVSENESFNYVSSFDDGDDDENDKSIDSKYSFKSETIIEHHPYIHESVLAMEIDNDSNIRIIKDINFDVSSCTKDDEGEIDYKLFTNSSQTLSDSCQSSISDSDEGQRDNGRNSADNDKKLKFSKLGKFNSVEETVTLVSNEVPLQRRNSIHNVPFVDVNDPGTRERMERYKEERRSLLRAKYKVEDYKQNQVPLRKMSDIFSQNKLETCKKTTQSETFLTTSLPHRTTSYPPTSLGLINEDVNVKQRAAIFGICPNQSTKDSSKSLVKTLNSRSPSKIKNMAAFFEQKK